MILMPWPAIGASIKFATYVDKKPPNTITNIGISRDVQVKYYIKYTVEEEGGLLYYII